MKPVFHKPMDGKDPAARQVGNFARFTILVFCIGYLLGFASAWVMLP